MKESVLKLDDGSKLCDYLDRRDVEKIYYRYGVWNDYMIIDYNRDELYNAIRNSAAGADLVVKDSSYFVSIPTENDLW